MNAKEALKVAMKAKGITYQMLGEPMGKNIQYVWNLINAKGSNLKADNLVKLLDIMGYKLVIVDKAVRVKNGIEIREE